MGKLTHHNSINLRMVRFVIILIQGLLSNSESSTDGLGVLEILRNGCQVFVDVVHGGNDSADVGCITQKKEGAMFENLL